jgi:hypothetical protein
MAHALIAVYRESDVAQDVAARLRESLPGAVQLESDDDREMSIRAEMQAEVDEAWGSPGMGMLVTAEQMRGAVLFVILGGALGALIGIPLGLIFASAWDLAWQIGIGALVGTLFGATVGGLLGGGYAMQSAMHPPAAQDGFTVRVTPPSRVAARVMSDADPIRIDRVSDGQRVDTPVTEGPEGLSENLVDTAEKFTAHTADARLR